MKKTLIALAAVAAVSASYAQVTLSGEFAYGYYSGTDSTKTSKSGLGIDTSLLNIKAGEDLGGGMRVDAAMSLSTAAGNGTAIGDNQSLTVTTPALSVSLLTYKGGDFTTGAAGGATWYGLDGKVLGARSWRDAISVTLPLSAALSVTGAYLEPSNEIGEGGGTDGTTGQNLYSIGAKYSAGPLVVQGAYLPYNNAGGTDASKVSATRFGASYDMGVAKAGFGVQVVKLGAGSVLTETSVAASAPLGANFSVNGQYSASNVSSASSTTAGLAGTRSGWMLGAQYNLSKRSYVILNNATWTGASATTTDTNTSSMTALTLVHDF